MVELSKKNQEMAKNKPSTLQHITFFTILSIGLFPAIAYYFASGTPKNLSQIVSYSLPAAVLVIIYAISLLTYFKATVVLPGQPDTHAFIQNIILLITIASFYAFGWPKSLEVAELSHKFAELCVCLALFLLAELAAFLTICSGQIQKDMVHTGEQISLEIKTQSESVSKTFSREGERVNSDIERLIAQVKPDEIVAAANTFKIYSHIENAVSGLDEHTKKAVLDELFKYTRQWTMLLRQDSEDSEARAATMTVFRDYIRREMENLRKEIDGVSYISLPASQEFYLSVLADLLEMLRKTNAGVFAWAICDGLPPRWYNWGKEYGEPGALDVMDRFREMVRILVQEKKIEYHRTFLIKGEDTDSEVTRLQLEAGDSVAKASKLVLLLLSETATGEFTEKSLRVTEWQSILGKGYMQDLKVEQKAYGIIEAENFSVMAKNGQLPNLNCRKNIAFGGKTIWVKPVKLLDYFGHCYQSENGMRFLVVSNSDDLVPLPVMNADWLIFGTHENNTHTPIIAISARSTMKSETLRMELFTQPKHLEDIKAFWTYAQNRSKVYCSPLRNGSKYGRIS